MRGHKGTTLIEALVGIAILSAVFAFAFGALALSADNLTRSKIRVLATAVANEQLETIRNMSYTAVGTTTGTPTGSIPATQTVTQSNISFTVSTRVDWVDDPFDKLVTDTPADTVPTDYKRAEVAVSWPNGDQPVKFTTTITPKGLESPSNTGSLLIDVFDASGLPVPVADVTVENTNLNPDVLIVSTTDINGKLQLLGLTPDLENYKITVTKAGYTTHRTYPADAQTPNPVKPNVAITAGGVTSLSFTIDHVSNLNFKTVDTSCQVLPAIGFTLRGQQLISNPPNPVLAFDQNFTTDGSGLRAVPNLPWDQYALTLMGTSRNIAGIIPPASLNVLPNSNTDVQLVLTDTYSTYSLLANVKDANTNQPISGATIEVSGEGSKVTGQGAWTQTTWNGGSGQAFLFDPTMYAADDGHVDVSSNPGQITLEQSTLNDSVTESFDDTTYRDPSTTAAWSSGEVRLPQTSGQYDASAIAQTLKLPLQDGKITQATLQVTDQSNGQTIQYQLTADGLTYEDVTPGVAHTFTATGNDLRVRMTLQTADPNVTPAIQEISLQTVIQAYATSGWVESSTFDTGSATNFITLSWNPESQSGPVGADAMRFQLAANDDDATWNFVGPDGTAGTYYTSSGSTVAAALQGLRYVRYKVFLQTEDAQYSPGISDISLAFTTGCTPPGQAFFGNLSNQTYTITITKAGYNPLTVVVDMTGNIQNAFALTPTS